MSHDATFVAGIRQVRDDVLGLICDSNMLRSEISDQRWHQFDFKGHSCLECGQQPSGETPQCSRSPTRPASAQERALHLEPQNAARLLGLTLLTRAAMAGVPEAPRCSLIAADGFPRGGTVSHRI